MPITGRDAAVAAAKRDQLARDDVRAEVRLGELDQPLERGDRVALRAKIERDEVGLAARQHRDRRRLVAEMAAVVDLGQRRLDRSVAAIDDQHLGPDPGDGPQRLADLVGVLDLIVEDVGMLGAKVADARQLRDIPGRLGVRQQCDPWTRTSAQPIDASRAARRNAISA